MAAIKTYKVITVKDQIISVFYSARAAELYMKKLKRDQVPFTFTTYFS